MVNTTEDGQVAYVKIPKEIAEKYNITYEDIHPISSLLKECEEIELGFTMYEEAEDKWRCSFRSDPKWIDVNMLAGRYGGGGHAGAAGLRITTNKPDQLLSEFIKITKTSHI